MPNPVTAPPGYQSSPTSGTNHIPVIPTAVDLPSALVAINVIAQAIAVLAQGIVPAATASSTASAPEGGTFLQIDQVTDTVVITDPNDSTVSVTVEQITGLTMRNAVTGELWVWSQG